MSEKLTLTDEMIVIAEALGEMKGRLEKIEGEFTTQAKPLEAAASALQASLAGIKTLQFHVLDNNLGALSARVEEHRTAIAEQVETIAAGLQRADADLAATLGRTADETRGQIAELQKQIGQVATQFARQLERVELEAVAKAKEFAVVPGPVGPAGRSITGRGQFAPGTKYAAGDVVSFVGGSYLSNADGNDEKPSAKSQRWTQLAARGPGGGAGDIKAVAGIDANLQAFLASATSANLAAAVSDETGSGSLVFATSPTLVTPVLGAATGTSIVLGGATGGATSGVVNAKGFKIDGVDVATSTDTYWNASGGGIDYSAGPVTLGHATASLALGAATETLTIAVTAAGAGTITAGGTNQRIDLLPTGTGWVNMKGAQSSGSAGTQTSLYLQSNDASPVALSFSYTGSATAADRRCTIESYDNAVGEIPLVLNPNGGLLLVGTTTNSANGKIQLAVHTASTGGIGFGADVNLYRSQANVLKTDDAFIVADTTASTSTSTGALVVSGGVGVAGNINTGGTLRFSTNASLPGTGSMGINATYGLNLYASTGSSYDLMVFSAAGTGLFSNATGTSNLKAWGDLNISGTTDSTDKDTGALVVEGGLGVEKAIVTGGAITTAAPTTGTAGAWKFGIRVAATTTLDTTQYIQLDVGGTLYKLAVVTV